jgi:Ca2+-binding RTX toxin-like protein
MSKKHIKPRRPNRPLSSLVNSEKTWKRFRPGYDFLEDRTLLSYMLPAVTQAYDNAVAQIGTLANTAAIIDQVLGVQALPLASQTLDQALGLANDFLTPFKTALTQNTSDWANTVEPELISAGFSIPVPFTGNPDSNNNLLEVTWSQTFTPTDPIQILGSTGFSYLGGAAGGLFGGITATGSVTVSLTFGVDVNPTSQQINFFVAPASNVVQASLSGSTASGGLSGTISIGDLASVNVTSTAGVNFNGNLGLKASSADTDGKLRTADLTSNLSNVVTGGVNGSATVNVSQFDAQLFGLPDLTWSGVISTSVVNNATQPESDQLNEPTASSLLSSLGSSLFSLGDGIPVLGTLSNTVNKPLPLIGESIAQLTGLDNYLPSLPSLPSGFSSLNNGIYPNFEGTGGTLTLNVTSTSIDDFLHGLNGPNDTLVSWQSSGNVDLLNEDITVPIYSIGVPDIASVELDATFGIHASLQYDVGFGLDGHGFYALAGTPTDPTLGLSFGVTAGVQGQVEVFGLPLAEAGGDIGFSVTPYVALTPAPTSVDPQSVPGKVYMSDLALFGKDPVTDLLDDLSAGIEGDFTGEVYASIDLLFFSLSWRWGIEIPVFNYERSPTWPSLTGSGSGATPWPNVTETAGGVLTFNGTAADDNVTVTQGTNNAVTLAWAGQGSETFQDVQKIVFKGGSGNDTLTAAPGLTIPVQAVGGSGNDTFDLRNSSANNTLIAGTGQNVLYGGSGSDLIIGGPGSDTLNAGSGASMIYGGSGNAVVNLGPGKDTFYGASGNYNIQGGSGTYMIDGGTGSDVIKAGTGSHNTIYGGSGGKNQITGSSGGYDTIYGGGAGDVIIGGGGNNSIYASGGSIPGSVTSNVITGGPLGNNTIFGGGGGDFLAGGIGSNNTIYAGTGTETLAGGDGLGLVVNPQGNGLINAAGDGKSAGNNTLIGGSGNDTLYGDSTGHNILQAGTGTDLLYAGSGGDTLVAGLGNDSLYGSIGNDTFQLPFTPSGQTQPNDTLVGGGGADTLLLKAESGTGTANLNVTASSIPDTTTTSVTVSNGLAVAADLPAQGGLVISIGSELMLVTAVNDNVLTVQRGYGGSTAAPHGNNLSVLLPDPQATPNDDKLYLNQAGAANQYTATLSTLRFATTVSGSKTVTGIDSTVGLAVGQAVSGVGVPVGTTIAAILSPTSIMLSIAATLSQGNLPLTFGTVGAITFTLPGGIPNIQLEGGPGNNLIQVDPSVTRNVTMYGGPDYNVLMAGSGNDILIAGPGTAVLYGGTGQDTLYGSDLPSQDAPPTAGADPVETVTNHTGNVDGNDVLIAGPGNDELFAGSGNDLLIGGSVTRLVDPATGIPSVGLLQNGQYQLVVGAGRDILVGGAGNDVLVAGPGGPGAVLEAGTGTNTLISQNYGVNTLSGGSGQSLLLGGNLENFEISNSAAGGGNTLVGGLGIDNLQAGAGSDTLYASYNAAEWSQGETNAAAVASYKGVPVGVHIVPPQLFQGDSTASQLQALLQAQQSGPLTSAQQNQLIALLTTEFNALSAEEATLNTQVSNFLAIPNLSQNPTLVAQLVAVATQDQYVQTETTALLNQILNALGAAGFQEDRLIGGTGPDTFYGNIQGATQMGGGTSDTFYNYNSSDTIQGGSGTNTLYLQDYSGNNTISLSLDGTNNVDFSVVGQPTVVVGSNVSNIQTLAVQLGSGNDTLAVNFASLPSGTMKALTLLAGTGNDTIDASLFTGQETITGGAGNDVVEVGGTIGSSSKLTGTPTSELEVNLEHSTSQLNIVTVNGSGLVVNSFPEPLSQLTTFTKLLVVGGPGTNTFTTDGSISDVVLEGGNGATTINNLTATGGTSQLIGGSNATNNFKVIGTGNYTINGGSPTVIPAAETPTGVAAPMPSGSSQTASALPQSGANIAGVTAGGFAIFAGGGTDEAETFNASTGQWSPQGQRVL